MTTAPLTPEEVQRPLLEWYAEHSRELPWRDSSDPYAVWVSETMLQQTRVATVIPYFERWMARFPTVQELASAESEDVMMMWQGLGYYSRARNLHAAANQVVDEYGGELPRTNYELLQLKGVGPYTAAAIGSICFDLPTAVVDGNVYRVITRLFAIDGDIQRSPTQHQVRRLAQRLMYEPAPGDWNQAVMELGAIVCLPKNPSCLICPLRDGCQSRQDGKALNRPFKGRKQKWRQENYLAVVVTTDERPPRFLVVQRPADGLLGDLWEVPLLPLDDKDALRSFVEELGLVEFVDMELHPVEHIFSHLRWYIEAKRFRVKETAAVELEGYHRHRWVAFPDIGSEVAVSTMMQKIMGSVGREDPDLHWRTSPYLG